MRIPLALAAAALLAGLLFWMFRHPRGATSAGESVGLSTGPAAAPAVWPSAPAAAGARPVDAVPTPTDPEAASVAEGVHLSPAGDRVNPPSARAAWDAHFLVRAGDARTGDTIRLALPGGREAVGTVGQIGRSDRAVVYVSGHLTAPEAGRFFVQRQERAGEPSSLVGIFEFPGTQRAYRIEPTGADGALELVERSLDEVLCVALPRPDGGVQMIPPLNPSGHPELPIPDYQAGVPLLQSLAGARAVIYLDFQGGYTPTWGGITYERPHLSARQIREIWQRVAEDFMPFQINVTTDLRTFEQATSNSRQRVIITPTDSAAPRAGGVAYGGSFNWSVETPCWVFVTQDVVSCAQTSSHEAGHALGLVHTGKSLPGGYREYYEGHGGGETGWAPIMGLGYYRNVSQWSRGEYADANNELDQLAILTSQTNVRYRPDDTGETLATARWLDLFDPDTARAEGLIETTGDIDAFRFTTRGGAVSLRADPVPLGPNLALAATLHDAEDNVLLDEHPRETLGVVVQTNLPAGTYTLRVKGAGRNNPLSDGFSPYGSLGYYSITGSVANARLASHFIIPENAPEGTLVGIVPVENPAGDPLVFNIVAGKAAGALAVDHSGALTVAKSSLFNYESLAQSSGRAARFELFVDVLNPANPDRNEHHRRVVVTVTDVNEPPQIIGMSGGLFSFPGFFDFRTTFGSVTDITLTTGGLSDGRTIIDNSVGGLGIVFTRCLLGPCSFTNSVPERAPIGTSMGRILASDPDFNTVLAYSIIAGNEEGLFAIDPATGALTVAGELVAARQPTHRLTVAVSDQAQPAPLVTTQVVTIKVELPFPRGSIACALYSGLADARITALETAAGFPLDPVAEKQLPRFEQSDARPERHGTVWRGYLLPPASGDYTFWIASGGNSELWISGSTNRDDRVRVAWIDGEGLATEPRKWGKYPSQRSAPIPLAAGHAYYIEARAAAEAGADYLGVAWSASGEAASATVIAGEHLAPYRMNYVPRPAGLTANLRRNAIEGTRVGRVLVTDINTNDLHTLKIAAGDEAGWFTIDARDGTIRLATEALLKTATSEIRTLQVTVTDNGTPPLTGVATVIIHLLPANTISTSTLRQEIWTNVGPGVSLNNLTQLPGYPNLPDALRELDDFDTRLDGLGPAGISRTRAYVLPPETGLYTFFIASDGESRLKFSADADPSAAAIIAWAAPASPYRDWTHSAAQQSGAKWLTTHQPCYIETLHRWHSGTGHLAVAWSGPGLDGTNVIAASFLAPVDLNHAPSLAGTNLSLSIQATNGTEIARLQARDSPADVLTYKLVAGNAGHAFALDPGTGSLVLIDNTVIASSPGAEFLLEVEVQDSGFGGLYPLKSTRATFQVRVVDDTPAPTWNGAGRDGNWSTAENWSPGRPRDGNKLTFLGMNRRTNHNDVLNRVGLVRINGVGFFMEGNPLILSGGLASTGDNTWAVRSLLAGRQEFSSHARTLTIAAPVNNNGFDLTLHAVGTIRLEGELSGSGALHKSGEGPLVLAARNTFTGPVVVRAGRLVLTHADALSGSPGLRLLERSFLDVSGVNEGFSILPHQTLSGVGHVLSPITIRGTLAPDSTSAPVVVTSSDLFVPGRFASQPGVSVWRLTFYHRVVLAGTTVIRLAGGTPQPSGVVLAEPPSALRVMDELQLGGRLVVTNTAAASLLTPGTSFRLFNAVRCSGAFDTISLPALGRELAWDTSRLEVDGTLRVRLASPALTPVRAAGGLISIRCPSRRDVTYRLESTPSLEADPVWTLVESRAGIDGFMLFILTPQPEVDSRFYRVRAEY